MSHPLARFDLDLAARLRRLDRAINPPLVFADVWAEAAVAVYCEEQMLSFLQRRPPMRRRRKRKLMAESHHG